MLEKAVKGEESSQRFIKSGKLLHVKCLVEHSKYKPGQIIMAANQTEVITAVVAVSDCCLESISPQHIFQSNSLWDLHSCLLNLRISVYFLSQLVQLISVWLSTVHSKLLIDFNSFVGLISLWFRSWSVCYTNFRTNDTTCTASFGSLLLNGIMMFLLASFSGLNPFFINITYGHFLLFFSL